MGDSERRKPHDEVHDAPRNGPIQVVIVNGASSDAEETSPNDWVKSILEALGSDEGWKAHKRATYLNPILLFVLVLIVLFQSLLKPRESEGLAEKDREQLKELISDIASAVSHNGAPQPDLTGPLGRVDKHLEELVTQAAVINSHLGQFGPPGYRDNQISEIAARLSLMDDKIASLIKNTPPQPSTIDVKVSPGALTQGASTPEAGSVSSTKGMRPQLGIEPPHELFSRTPLPKAIPIAYRNGEERPILIFGTHAYMIENLTNSDMLQLTCAEGGAGSEIIDPLSWKTIQVNIDGHGKTDAWMVVCTTFGFSGEPRFTSRFSYTIDVKNQTFGKPEEHFYSR